MGNTLRKGDSVMWRGCFGKAIPKKVIVTSIEVNCIKKIGIKVISSNWDYVKRKDTIVEFDNGHWSYGIQIDQI
tara:strand:- start:2744 stop:2965 length:222 start_codon:yes stop_codon:yes gene_type:complete